MVAMLIWQIAFLFKIKLEALYSIDSFVPFFYVTQISNPMAELPFFFFPVCCKSEHKTRFFSCHRPRIHKYNLKLGKVEGLFSSHAVSYRKEVSIPTKVHSAFFNL